MSRYPLENLRRTALAFCVILYILLWIGGILNHWLLGGVDQSLVWLGSLFLLLAGALLFLTTRSFIEAKMLAGFALFGLAAEMVGVYTGFPFGSYAYTETLGWRVLGVPPVMACAWMTLILYAREILLPFRLPRFAESIAAALLVTVIDLLIDPVAVNQLGYWQWASGGAYYNIPLTNFAGWFLTGTAAFYLFQRKSASNIWRLRIGFSIVLFFTLLAFIYHLYPAALVGCLACLPYFLSKKGITTFETPERTQAADRTEAAS